MNFLSLAFPNIDPVLVELGPLPIRWYSLAYIFGILGGWWYLGYLNKKYPVMNKKAFEDIIIWAVVGVVGGGRLGYVLFYRPMDYLANPLEIFMLWKGGMSFHGGLLGVLVAMYLFTRHFKLSYFKVTDLVACVVPIGLFFGRLANFVNGELFGRITPVAWGMVFPYGGDEPRHPSQLYQAAMEGLLLFGIMCFVFHYKDFRKRTGFLSGTFLCGYGVFRIIAEFFREPDENMGFFLGFTTMGQILCLPMIAFGAFLIHRAMKKYRAA